MDFSIGEKVVYPNQGVGVIEQISTRNLGGTPEAFYLLKINSNSLRVMVPLSNAGNVGLRRVVKNREISSILGFLEKGRSKATADWKCRFKENSLKMRSGSLQQVAEVFKCLVMLSQAKALSFREKKMLDRSWQLLVDEVSIVRNLNKETVESLLVKTLSKSSLRMLLPS